MKDWRGKRYRGVLYGWCSYVCGIDYIPIMCFWLIDQSTTDPAYLVSHRLPSPRILLPPNLYLGTYTLASITIGLGIFCRIWDDRMAVDLSTTSFASKKAAV